MPTLAAGRARLIQDLGIGESYPSGVMDAAAAGSVTSSRYFRNSNWGPNQFTGKGIHRPDAATAADFFRVAGTLTPTSGLLAHTGASYSDTTTTSETLNIIAAGIDPLQDLDAALNRALEFLAFTAWEPLSLAPDAAMRESGTTSWGTASSASSAKTSTALSGRIFPGFIRSHAVTNSGVNGYLPSANINVSAGEQIVVIGLVRVNSGTSAQLTLFDVTGSAVFGTAVTSVYKTWQWVFQSANVPAGCRDINVRLGGTGASDVTDWQGLWVYRVNADMTFQLQSSYIDEAFKIDGLAYTTMNMASGSGTYEALAMDPQEISRLEYSPNIMAPAANPSFIQFHKSGRRWAQYPLWLTLSLPYSERGTLSAESDTTACPLHLWIPAAEVQLLSSCPEAVQASRKTLAQCQAELATAVRERTVTGPAQRMPQRGVLIGGVP